MNKLSKACVAKMDKIIHQRNKDSVPKRKSTEKNSNRKDENKF